MKIAAVAIAAAMLAATAHAEDLWMTGFSATSTDFADKSTLKIVDGNMRRMWVTRVMADSSSPPKTNEIAKRLYSFNCSEETSQVLASSSYDAQLTFKSSLDTPDTPKYPVPDSMGAKLMNFACHPERADERDHYPGKDAVVVAEIVFRIMAEDGAAEKH
jgi:hypothetical protein